MSKVSITYIGKRVAGEKIVQAFIDHKGETVHFTGVKYLSIGAIYRATAKGETGLSIARTPEELGLVEDEAKVESWRIDEQLANEFSRRKRASAKSSKSDTIKRLASILKPLANEFSASQLHEVLELAVDEATREIREEQNRRMSAQLQKALKRIAKKEKAK